jgi:hypothetical protein
MRRATLELELEPTVAARRALIALLEAATYSGKGMRTVGRRVGSRAAVVGAEGARRAGGAVHVLRVGQPVQGGNTGRVMIAATAGGAAGAAAALAIRYGMAVRRANGKPVEYPPGVTADSPEADTDAGVMNGPDR